MLNCLAAAAMGPTGVCHCTKYRPGAGIMPYGPKCIYVLEQNDALQRLKIMPKALLPC